MDSMLTMVHTTVKAQIGDHNGLVAKVQAATTDKGRLVHDLREDENTQDETVQAFQAWHEKAKSAIEDKIAEVNAYIEANLLNVEPVDVDALKTEIAALRAQIKTAVAFASALPTYDETEFVLPDIKSLRGGSTGSATGGKRPRLDWIKVNGEIAEGIRKVKGKDDVTVSNFSVAAAAITKILGSKVEVKDLQSAAFATAGTDDLSTLAGTPFSFNFEAADKDGNPVTFDIEVAPRTETAEDAESDKDEDEASDEVNGDEVADNSEAANV